jgi:hypothetical protein
MSVPSSYVELNKAATHLKSFLVQAEEDGLDKSIVGAGRRALVLVQMGLRATKEGSEGFRWPKLVTKGGPLPEEE